MHDARNRDARPSTCSTGHRLHESRQPLHARPALRRRAPAHRGRPRWRPGRHRRVRRARRARRCASLALAALRPRRQHDQGAPGGAGRGHRQGARPPRSAPPSSSRTPTSRRSPRRASRPSRTSPAPLRLGAGAARPLARRPADVTLSSLNGTIGGGERGRRLRHPRRDLRAGDRAHGLHPSQTAGRPLMARLRNIDGVTRVSLSQVRARPTRPPAAPRRPPADASAPCGKGSPAEFELVMFFERRRRSPTRSPTATGAPPAPAGTAERRRPTPDRAGRRHRRRTDDPAANGSATARRRPPREAIPVTRTKHDPARRRGRSSPRSAPTGCSSSRPSARRPPSSTPQIATQQAELAQAAGRRWPTYEKARRQPTRRNYATVARLGKAVPADDDVRSLLVQLDAAAERSGVDFGTINVGGGSARADRRPPAADAARPTPRRPRARRRSARAGFSAMPFTFTFKGSFFEPRRRSSTGSTSFVSGQQRQARRHRPPAAAREHLAHARHGEGLPAHHGRGRARTPTWCRRPRA